MKESFPFFNVNEVGAGSRVKLMGIPQNEINPPPFQMVINNHPRLQVEGGAGLDELISYNKIFGETRPYDFTYVNGRWALLN